MDNPRLANEALVERRERLKQMKAGHTSKNIRQFIERYERDNVRDMSAAEWGSWVDALPVPEFMAMCCMTSDEAAAALREAP